MPDKIEMKSERGGPEIRRIKIDTTLTTEQIKREFECAMDTPSPMGFRNEILDRPRNETPVLLLVAGYPSQDAEVPDIEKLLFDTVVRYIG